MDRGWARRAGQAPELPLLFFNWRELNRESERQKGEMRDRTRSREEEGGGGEREVCARREVRGRGMKSSGWGERHSEAQVAELGGEPHGPSPAAAAPGSPARPGPARLGPPAGEAAGRGRGPPTWGAAQPRSPESLEPGSAAAATETSGERSAASGGGERLQRRSPGLGESANIFQTDSNFPSSPAFWGLLDGIVLPISRGAGARFLPGFLRGSANFADPGTRGLRPSAEPSPRFSPL